jgi:uncharacterized membrane protein
MSPWLNASIVWWSSVYGNHASVALTVTFLHVAGVVVAGGTALTLDRQILRGRRAGQEDRRFCLRMVADAHKPVVAALSVTVLSGLLLVLADAETFLHSGLFWVKMAVFALLAANGGLVMFARTAASRSDGASGWTLLAGASAASAVLWLTVVLLGEWLRVAA